MRLLIPGLFVSISQLHVLPHVEKQLRRELEDAGREFVVLVFDDEGQSFHARRLQQRLGKVGVLCDDLVQSGQNSRYRII